jgi:hypothetical protein
LLWDEQAGLCHYTGLPMKLSRDNTKSSVSIDRLDSNKGYVEGNVVLCRADVNIMKGNMSITEFKELVSILAERLDQF